MLPPCQVVPKPRTMLLPCQVVPKPGTMLSPCQVVPKPSLPGERLPQRGGGEPRS